MDENTIYKNLLRFFVSLVADFYKKSTSKELPNILTVFNTGIYKSNDADSPTGPLNNFISDKKLQNCIRQGVEFLKKFIKKMQTTIDGGIPVTGGSVEAWRMDNIAIDIISHNIKLHGVSDFELEELNSNLKDGVVTLKVKWSEPFLSQSYILNGIIDGKKVSGSGDFKILVTNFTMDFQVKFKEHSNKAEIVDLKLRADFDDAKVQVTGLEVEGSGNAEEIMNRTIQRDKPKFKEMLLTNTLVLSDQTKMVLNAKLQQMPKSVIVAMINSWCNQV